MLIVANSAVAAAVLILPMSVRRECYDIAGDDFECSKGLANVCRSDDLQAATHACEKLGQCVAVVGSKPSYTLKPRHTPVLGSSCQQIVEDVHTTMRCRISHARRWSQNRCRGSKPWVADREDFRHLSLGSGANNSTFDGDTTMRDDPTLHRALRCEGEERCWHAVAVVGRDDLRRADAAVAAAHAMWLTEHRRQRLDR